MEKNNDVVTRLLAGLEYLTPGCEGHSVVCAAIVEIQRLRRELKDTAERFGQYVYDNPMAVFGVNGSVHYPKEARERDALREELDKAREELDKAREELEAARHVIAAGRTWKNIPETASDVIGVSITMAFIASIEGYDARYGGPR